MAKPSPPRPSSSRSQLPPRRRKPPCASPSVAVLAALATLSAAASTVDGLPLGLRPPPPDFLCPLLLPDPQPQSPPLRRDTRRDVYPNPIIKRDSSRPFVPAKYEQGQDGRWRKSSSWSLYGSAFCGDTQCAPQDTNIPVVDNQIQTSQTTTTTLTPTVDADMSPSQLPPGWNPNPKDDHVITAVILVLSLVLALVICGFMVCCILWRKKRRARARDSQDVEQKEKFPAYDDSLDESQHIKRARFQQRVWSKATARWRANVRLSARQRRAQRSAAVRDSPTPSASTSNASLHTLSSSTSLSRRNVGPVSNDPSVVVPSLNEQPDDPAHDSSSTSPVPAHVPPSPPPHLSLHPPAYRTDSGRSSLDTLPDMSDPSGARPLVTIVTASSLHEEETHPSYLPSDAAHVATDDKVLLARMATLASAPPAETSTDFHQVDAGTFSAAIYPSVPVLDEYEDVAMNTSSLGVQESGPEDSSSQIPESPPAPSYSHDPSSPPFPLPPAKSRLAAPLFYEYPSSFADDVVGTDPSSEPSAPPFEVAAAAPSAPPLDLGEEMYVVPSAPPMGEGAEDRHGIGDPDTPMMDSDQALSPDLVVAVTTGGEQDPAPDSDNALSSAGSPSTSHRRSRVQTRRPPDYLP